VLLLAVALQLPGALLLDFEDQADGTAVDLAYEGIEFRNAVALSTSLSLNDAEFPPHSGSIVAADVYGPVEISFVTPIAGFSGFFTYLFPLTLTAFDSNETVIGSASSLFTNNLMMSGDAGSVPNELLSVSSSHGISRLLIVSHPVGGSFTLDDVAISPETATPEPGSLLTAGTALLGALIGGWRRARRSSLR
jgi:hypothetical protein